MKNNEMDSTTMLIKSLTEHRLLTSEEELECGKAIKFGTEEEKELAIEKLVAYNGRLVVGLARGFLGKGLDLADLIQEGIIGLIRAANGYDFEKEYKFSTYATWWVNQHIQRGVADKGKPIRLPVHMVETINRLYRVSRTLEAEFDREPTFEEIAERINFKEETVETIYDVVKASDVWWNMVDADKTQVESLVNDAKLLFTEEMADDVEVIVKVMIRIFKKGEPTVENILKKVNMSVEKIEKTMTSDASMTSLDMNVSEDGETSLGSMIPDEVNVADSVEQIMIKEGVKEVLDSLPERTKIIVEHRFGFIDGKPKTLDEVGKLEGVNVSRERVRQIEKKLLKDKSFISKLAKVHGIEPEVWLNSLPV